MKIVDLEDGTRDVVARRSCRGQHMHMLAEGTRMRRCLRGALPRRFLIFVGPAAIIGHRPAVERAFEALRLVVGIVDQDDHRLSLDVNAGIVVPAALGRVDAVADEDDVAVGKRDIRLHLIAVGDHVGAPFEGQRRGASGDPQSGGRRGRLDQGHVLEPAALVAGLQEHDEHEHERHEDVYDDDERGHGTSGYRENAYLGRFAAKGKGVCNGGDLLSGESGSSRGPCPMRDGLRRAGTGAGLRRPQPCQAKVAAPQEGKRQFGS